MEESAAMEASAPMTTEATPVPDAGPPKFHPGRVGTTAVVDDSPSVGTTARVPDKKK